MRFYEVLVSDLGYRSKEPLTYQHSDNLKIGTIVTVFLKNKLVLGTILRKVAKPDFDTKQIIRVLEISEIPKELLLLATWMSKYYPSGIGSVLQQFLPQKLISETSYDLRSDRSNIRYDLLQRLTKEQQMAMDLIKKPDTYIVHGDTGTGKTRLYLELALEQFKRGRSSIILTPEIGLTPQLTKSFIEILGEENVITTHSRLSESQRIASWLYILNTRKPLVVIGPRSALFSPVHELGLIILDESHENAYKQEQSPHYHATRVAAKLSELHNAILILGSATPSIVDYYLANIREKQILRLKTPASGLSDVSITTIDLKDRSKFSKYNHISDELINSIKESIQNGEQSLVFMNRRGTARTILCSNCGWQALCPHCNLPLTYHGDIYIILCHTCGFRSSAPTSCPICKGVNIRMKSIGTKAIVEELATAFPNAKIQRFDLDNKKNERLETQYIDIKSGKVDILVGTQIIAKGLDLPKLSTVGVAIADTDLYLPDYTSQERSYQLLRQVIGRVGRGHRAARVIVQSYEPDNPTIQSALHNNWEEFYKREITERKKFMFPPYYQLLKITCRRKKSENAKKALDKIAADFRKKELEINIDNPCPSLHEKYGDYYQWHLVVKAKKRSELLRAIELLPNGATFDIDPLNLL